MKPDRPRGFANDAERQRSEEAVLRGEARLRAVLETAVDAIITIDARGCMQSVNRASERMFGYSAAEMIGQNVNMLMPAPYRQEHDGYLTRYLQTGEKHIIGIGREVQARRKDGTVFPVDLAVSEVEPGKLFTGIIRDISERKRHEEAVRQSEARLRTLLDTAVDAIITIDHRGCIQSINPATERMFGYETSELLGQNVNILMPSPYEEEHDDNLARYLKTGEERIIGTGREVQARRKDGTVFPVDLAVSQVEPGKVFTGIIRDISDRKLGEARLREADRMASIGSLAAGLGHDMNNVLLPVRAHLNALKATNEAPPNRLEHLAKIAAGVSYLQQLADGLHFLAMDPDQVEDGDGTTDLNAWWAQTGPLLSKAVPKHVRVTASLPPELPEVAVAPHALTQAMLNLIVNAGEAIPSPAQRKRRQGYVRLSAEIAGDGSAVRLAVADNGSGMTEEVKRRAFDMFFTTKPRGLGTGLGLAMVRKVVERAGGSIQVDSQPGKGTTVKLILPAVNTQEGGSAITAAIHVCDGRTASLIRNLLEASGAQIAERDDPAAADVWVTDSSSTDVSAAEVWRAEHPTGRIVLVGKPDPHCMIAWRSLHALIIEAPTDLEAVRTALGQAMAT